MFKRNQPKAIPAIPVGEYRRPNAYDMQDHYRSAEYWLRVAEQPGRGAAATGAAASLSQAHATIALAALQILMNSKVSRDINEATRRFVGGAS